VESKQAVRDDRFCHGAFFDSYFLPDDDEDPAPDDDEPPPLGVYEE
jgi:hypothetical protein